MKTLELFAGTKSFSKEAWARGHGTYTVDNDPQFRCDATMDVLGISNVHTCFSPKFDIFWASIPCTTYSTMSIGTHWTGGKGAYIPKTEECKVGLALLEKTVSLITELEPTFWFFENPCAMMRNVIDAIFKKYGFNQDNAVRLNKAKPWQISECDSYVRRELSYCTYGGRNMKPTDIWTNCKDWTPREKCKNGNPDHMPAPRGSSQGTQGKENKKERGRIPPQLCEEIIIACESSIDTRG